MTSIILIFLASLASGIDASVTLSDGINTISTSTRMDLAQDDEMRKSFSLGFDPYPAVSMKSEGKAGSGPLNESYSIRNKEGDYATISAGLTGSRSWMFAYRLASSPGGVLACERIRVDDGTGLEFTGRAGNARGDHAEVWAVGREGSMQSMEYSNEVAARADMARAGQWVSRGSDEGGPLILVGRAWRMSEETDWDAGIVSEVMGASSIRSAISVGSSDRGAAGSGQLISRGFEGIRSLGVAESGSFGENSTRRHVSVEAGGSYGDAFRSQTESFATGSGAGACSQVAASGDDLFKSSLAEVDYCNITDSFSLRSGTYASALDGLMNTRDHAVAEGRSTGVMENLVLSGEIYRQIFSEGMQEGGPWGNIAYAEVGFPGHLRGRSTASSSPEAARVQGRWHAVSDLEFYERTAVGGNSSLAAGITALMISPSTFIEYALGTNETFDAA